MNQMQINQQLMIEAQQDNVRLRRELTEARTETRQMRQLVEELQETVRHYQRADVGPVHKGSVFVGGQVVEIP